MSNIVLMGYRGCGKTSLGQKIAKKTWKEFVDTDERVRDRFDGAVIAEIWETHGEPAFRAAEAEVAREAMAESGSVIALGGGTLMHPDGRAAVEAATDAKRIYLHCRSAVLAERIAADPAGTGNRPGLTEGSSGAADPDEIAKVLEERDPVYREVADAVLDVTYLDLDGALTYIMRTYA